jgi:hypothetical protein
MPETQSRCPAPGARTQATNGAGLSERVPRSTPAFRATQPHSSSPVALSVRLNQPRPGGSRRMA